MNRKEELEKALRTIKKMIVCEGTEVEDFYNCIGEKENYSEYGFGCIGCKYRAEPKEMVEALSIAYEYLLKEHIAK